jgi:hypothetical protein
VQVFVSAFSGFTIGIEQLKNVYPHMLYRHMLYAGQVAGHGPALWHVSFEMLSMQPHFLNILPVYAVLNKEGMKWPVGYPFKFAFQRPLASTTMPHVSSKEKSRI